MKQNKYSAESIIAVVLMLLMLVVLTGQVIGRYCFHQSNSWSEELSRYLFVWFVMITASLACLEGAHIKVEVALNLFPQKLRPSIELLGLLIFIGYALLTAYLSGQYTLTMYQMGQVSQGLRLPMCYVYSAIPICHVLMAIRCLQWLIAKAKKKGQDAESVLNVVQETQAPARISENAGGTSL